MAPVKVPNAAKTVAFAAHAKAAVGKKRKGSEISEDDPAFQQAAIQFYKQQMKTRVTDKIKGQGQSTQEGASL